MKLTDFDNKKHAETALRETFEVSIDVESLDKSQAKKMLAKVSNLIAEAKSSPDFYSQQTKPSYMKLVFMEQALSKHYKNLSLQPPAEIVVENEIINENEEVEKSQVILAAQDMVDNVQKMYEDINDMLVKELPALVDSIESEIGVNESTTFQEQVSTALTTLNDALQGAKDSLGSSLNQLTGQPGADLDAGFGAEEPLPAPEEEVDMEVDTEIDTGTEELPAPDLEEPEDETGVIGREKR